MFSGKDTANAAYPTQWALNPSAYQNVDSNSVDWAALAQQWIAMKEAATIVGVSQAKGDVEEGEAPMEVENPDTNNDVPVAPGADWNSSNNWGGTWNQWGWGWPGAQQLDPKIAADPTMAVPPIIDGFQAGDNPPAIPGYTTASVQQPTFQHGYWTVPQTDATANNRTTNRTIDRRSKSKNREIKPPRPRTNRDKPPMIPPVMEPIMMPTPVVAATIDAAKRRQLPAWIREGLEKMEREKQRAIEREQEKKAREEAELEKKRLEEEELERIKLAAASGEPILPVKSKFETDSEGEESEREDKGAHQEAAEPPAVVRPVPEPEPQTLIKKTKEEIMQEVMLAVRRSLTEILLEVTDQEIHTVSQEELARYNTAQASRLNAMKASKSKALAAIASGLGLGAYESSDSEEEQDLSDQQLQEIIRRKKAEFERTSREIEADVRRAELREEELTSPTTTPERPRLKSSVTPPPPIDSDTPEKKPERRNSKDKRSHKLIDKVETHRHLEAIPEERHKKSNKHSDYIRETSTPSPQRTNKSNNKQSSSSSSDSEDDSSSSSSSLESVAEKVESVRTNKRKCRSSSSTESRKKRKQKKEKRSSDKYNKSKHQDTHEKSDKYKSKKRDNHKSRSRDERSHRDRYGSDDDRPKKRSKRSRSISYESRSDRRRGSRDRSDDRSHRRDKYDRDSSKRDRSYDRSGRDYDRYDRYERSRDRDRRRSRSGSHRHRR